MNRIAMLSLLGLCASTGALARAQSSAPTAYTVEAKGAFVDRTMTVTVLRDGARERVEVAIDRAGTMTSLYDFAAHRVYWIGWSGAGTCSSGRYLSARAPVDQDPVTGTADNLVKLAEGRARKAEGSGTVAGRAARIEAFVGGRRPAEKDAPPWPRRVWLAEADGVLLKVEGEGAGGKPVTLLEVTGLTLGKPRGAALEPPQGCTPTDSEMDDTGQIRAHAEASMTAQAGGAAELGSGAAAGKASPARLAKIDGLALSVAPQPDDGPCGTKLRLTATVSADGPATIQYRFLPSVGGMRFPSEQGGRVILDAAGATTLTVDAIPARSGKGDLRLQAQVLGEKGHDGPLKKSDAAPFQVTCR